MNSRQSPTGDDVPVVCRVCQTRLYATADQIGRNIACPDCHALNPVVAPSQPVVKETRLTGDEYRLADETATVSRPAVDLIKVVCGTCYTLMHARAEHAGKRVKCPDCGTICVIPRPTAKPTPFRAPDASDVAFEPAPPPLIDEKRKEFADRLIADAGEHVGRQRLERPKPPRDPLRDGIYSFPFYANVIPLWAGTAIALLIDLALLDVLIDVVQGGGLASILAAFLAPIVTIVTICIVGLVAPHYLTIIEFTANGYDKIPHWPSQDLLSRGGAIMFGVNALAMSSMPGMLLVGLLHPLGVPMQLGLCSTVLLLPLVVLSMLENDSIFAPYSKFVFSGLRRHYDQWSRFYVQAILLALAVVAFDYIVWTTVGEASSRTPGISAMFEGNNNVRQYISRAAAAFSLSLYAVIYCRLIGRMAWILGQVEVDSDEEATEEDENRVTDEGQE